MDDIETGPALQPVLVIGVPRSGTSWLGRIFASSPQVRFRFQPLFSYAFKNALDLSSTRAEILAFLDAIARSDDAFLRFGLGPRSDAPEPAGATHLVFKQVRHVHLLAHLMAEVPELRVVALVRHPLAVLASWRRAPREWDSDWDWEDEWREAPSKYGGQPENVYGYRPWRAVTAHFLALERSRPERLLITRYQDLLTHTEAEVERLFSFCGLPLGPETRSFLRATTERDDDDPYGVHRRKRERDDKWVGQLDSGTVAEVEADLERSGLAPLFDWERHQWLAARNGDG